MDPETETCVPLENGNPIPPENENPVPSENENPVSTCKFCINCPFKNVKKVEESSDDGSLKINSLPKEILIKIFGYFKQNELYNIARVCKTWNECTKCDVLWKKVDRKVYGIHDSKNEAAKDVIRNLRFCTTHLKLDFGNMTDQLMFEELSMMLRKHCPHLHTLIFCYAKLAVNLECVVKICAYYLRNLRVLVLRNSQFGSNPTIGEYKDISQLEILDVRRCLPAVGNRPIFSDMPYLKKLCLADIININDTWFVHDDIPFLNQLEALDMGNTLIRIESFLSIRTHARHLVELYLCRTSVNNFELKEFKFPLLKTICLRSCYNVSCNGVVDLIKSCESLENLYVEVDVIQAYEKSDYIAQNKNKLGIVKEADSDNHFPLKNYME